MTVTDTLTTILELRGAEVALEGFSRLGERLLETAAAGEVLEAAEERVAAAQTALLAPITAMVVETQVLTASLLESVVGFGAVAAAEGVMAATTGVLGAALALLLAPLSLVLLAVAAVTAGIALAVKGLEAFSNSEAHLARAALQLQNLKGSIPIGELVEFSNHLEELTGINHNVITTLGASAAQWGLNTEQIKKMLPVVLDISQAKGVDPEVVEKALFRASRGQSRGLLALGIDPSKIHGDLKNIDNLVSQVGKGFSGVAEGFRSTLPGTVSALGSAMERLFEALGRFISPVVVPLLNMMITDIEVLTEALDRMAKFFHLPTSATIGAGRATSDIALKGDPEQTNELKKISKNTEKVAEAFIKNVIGGAGSVARSALTMRDIRLGVGI